jgi:vancomycin permeability regulator SanA
VRKKKTVTSVSKPKKSLGRKLRWPLLILAIFIGAWAGIVHSVNGYDSYISYDAKKIKPEPVAIILGAGLRNGKPSLVLKLRLDGGIQLYKLGKVKKLLMSGDNRFHEYNEPEAMRVYAVDHGVPNEDIILDYAGRDTYDTAYRAFHVFGVRHAILVTQQFHTPRALYLHRRMGIDATAYALPDLDMIGEPQLVYDAREYLADVKAWWDVNFSHRKPYIDQRLSKT